MARQRLPLTFAVRLTQELADRLEWLHLWEGTTRGATIRMALEDWFSGAAVTGSTAMLEYSEWRRHRERGGKTGMQAWVGRYRLLHPPITEGTGVSVPLESIALNKGDA